MVGVSNVVWCIGSLGCDVVMVSSWCIVCCHYWSWPRRGCCCGWCWLVGCVCVGCVCDCLVGLLVVRLVVCVCLVACLIG